jgi:low temperature requirement protein LtrA
MKSVQWATGAVRPSWIELFQDLVVVVTILIGTAALEEWVRSGRREESAAVHAG